jgi:hypothetical protein
VPVCLFLGNPARGLTSHFYSAFDEECAAVKVRWPDEWRLDTDELFRVHLVNPTAGLYLPATKAVCRLWNRRAAADLCSGCGDVMRIDLTWDGTTLVETREGGRLRPGTVVAARLRFPANASSLQRLGQVRLYEHVDAPADRQLTVSTSGCDFRGFFAGSASRTDPTSATAPMAWSNDQTPALIFDINVGTAPIRLLTGQTYYFNLRNVNWFSGMTSCEMGTCNGRFQFTTPF